MLLLRSKPHHRPHPMALQGNGNETVTHEHNKVNLEGQEMQKLIKYVREIEFFDGIQKKKLSRKIINSFKTKIQYKFHKNKCKITVFV
jgi:hypothetical protein